MLRCSRGGAAEYSSPGQAEAALVSRDGAAGQQLAWAGRSGAGEPGRSCWAAASLLAVSVMV